MNFHIHNIGETRITIDEIVNPFIKLVIVNNKTGVWRLSV